VTAGVLVSLAACNSEEPGTPTAGDTTRPTGSTAGSTPPTAPTSGGSGLGALDPCELLTAGELTQLGLPPGKADTVAGYPVCEWNPQGPAIVDLTLRPNKGLDDLNTAGRTATDVSIGSHAGRRLEGPTAGRCGFDLAITERSSVTVGALHDQTPAACALAERVANVIEPKLPRG
jgi:hypothetical protein